jgi:hypothetical protein
VALPVVPVRGGCLICGYDRCIAALQFHHVDPREKSFHVSRDGVSLSLERAREEARKCVLLCSNCHAEVEAGFTSLPELSFDRALPTIRGSASDGPG